MSVFRKNVERWRTVVAEELAARKYPMPVDLVLSTIENESKGKVGTVNTGSGASGIMQVRPATLDTYNANNKSAKVTLAQLRGTSSAAARAQIRVGLWVLNHYWKKVRGWYQKYQAEPPAFIDQALFGDSSYLLGWGNVKPKMDQLLAAKKPVEWTVCASTWPGWGGLSNRPIGRGQEIWNRYIQAGGDAGGGGADPDVDPDPDDDLDDDVEDSRPFVPTAAGETAALVCVVVALVVAAVIVLLLSERGRG